MFLDHLISPALADFIPELTSSDATFVALDTLTPAQTLSAQKKTSDWLQSFSEDDKEILTQAQEEKVANVFNALMLRDPDTKDKLLQMEVPEEVQSAISMVTAYQWKFVEQAENLRSLAVTKIVKDTDHPDARIRLKALELLGKVTEVALFTDRVEVKRQEMSDDELEKRIKEKLGRYMGAVDVVDVVEKVRIVQKNDDEIK